MTGNDSARFRQLKKYMEDLCYTCTEEWLQACIDWINENYPDSTSDLELFKRELREQWVDANLVELESSCLPPDLARQRYVKLPRNYGLQVNSIQDIGESSYSQWNKLKKLENENASVTATDSNEYKPSWQPSPKRCLYLTLTDGNQTVFGLEMEPNANLSINMKPGVKIIVVGPVDCRRGVLHLWKRNINVVGGEVESLMETNTLENVLANALNVNPSQVQSGTGTIQSRSSNRSTTQSSVITSMRQDEVVGDFPDSEGQFPDMNVFSAEDDALLMEIDEEAILNSASGSNVLSSSDTTSTSSNRSRSSGQITTQEISDVDEMEIVEDLEEDVRFARSTTNSASAINRTSRQPHTSAQIQGVRASSDSKSNSTVPSLDLDSKAKSVFVPPFINKPNPTNKVQSKMHNMAHANAAVSSSSKVKESTKAKFKSVPASAITSSTSFRSAKSIIMSESDNSNATNDSSSKTTSGNGKQLNILQYMKPMPVIIDPRTPERPPKRRRPANTVKVEVQENVDGKNESHADIHHDDLGAFEEGDDEILNEDEAISLDSLMGIVDAKIESKLQEEESEGQTQISSSAITETNFPSRLKYPVKTDEHPYIFLQQVQEKLDQFRAKRTVIHVKACVSTVVSNIRAENGCWTLRVCINDGTGYLNCSISHNIITEMVGFTPNEIKRLKAAKTPEGKARMIESMSGFSQQLIHLNAIFAIEMGDQPMIIEVIDAKLHHSIALKNKLSQIGL